MDNLGVHKGPRMRETIERAGARLLSLPLYSPDLAPIELAFSKRKAAWPRTRETLEAAIGAAPALITAADARGWCGHCGHNHAAQPP